ncbi:putative lysine methyltransferase, S-adenosyl-L-methionine-dependent methyltransferase [Helianthus annuus]|nr:putative lysine methyltransferase, S-adenosyl-L-methionine-dependent methyltransferase [Helianthus annuus]KAJ0787360.1 putative lysine methyltransferase, S-adenosyl-L-methionine-dependent methyltransferase [Helianthus annuus]
MDAERYTCYLQIVISICFWLNSPQTSAVLFEVMGYQLQFCQDPNSKHLGTTVWDASMVLVKYLEKNCRKGRFSPSKLKGKRVIELGAGCGVAGFGMAMLGCDVVSTDQVEVLPLLMRNVERNTSRIMQMNPDAGSLIIFLIIRVPFPPHSVDSIGSITAAELSWGNDDHIRALDPPFDYIIGTDVIGYEIRSTNVHEQMIQLWKKHFEVKTVPKSKMDIKYRHPSIQLYIMTLKTPEGIPNLDPVTENTAAEKIDDEADATEKVEDEAPQESRTLSDWEARRYGAMAARLLRDIKIS